jgi:hypothetical protein
MERQTKRYRAKSTGVVATKRAPTLKPRLVDDALLKRGIQVLLDNLGPADMARFLTVLKTEGPSDYTRDKYKLQPKWTLDDMKRMFIDNKK